MKQLLLKVIWERGINLEKTIKLYKNIITIHKTTGSTVTTKSFCLLTWRGKEEYKKPLERLKGLQISGLIMKNSKEMQKTLDLNYLTRCKKNYKDRNTDFTYECFRKKKKNVSSF